MSKGVDRIADVIVESYDNAIREIELIPVWISYRFEYDRLVTQEQVELAQQGVDAMASVIGKGHSSTLINIPIEFDRIRELRKTNSDESIKNVLNNFELFHKQYLKRQI